MTNDLISRSALLEKAVWVVEYDESGCGFDMKAVPIEDVLKAPAVDAVEVVRCKDCKYSSVRRYDFNGEIYSVFCYRYSEKRTEKAFCSYGERRADE